MPEKESNTASVLVAQFLEHALKAIEDVSAEIDEMWAKLSAIEKDLQKQINELKVENAKHASAKFYGIVGAFISACTVVLGSLILELLK